MGNTIQSIRGMNDLLPADSGIWRQIERAIADLLLSYGYSEIRMPILEKTELFCRSIGEVTDIVEKEMYTFADRNGDNLTLRPEGTASCVRAALQNGLLRGQIQRLWYMGPMFRHERPQKGRYRQFHQVGVEVFSAPGADMDAEMIVMSARLWQMLGLEGLELQLNSLGSSQARADYRKLLVEYLTDHKQQLDEDSLRRLETNPLRILDSKNSELQELIEAAPQLQNNLDSESAEHFAQLRGLLDKSGVEYVINPRLVRGLDYYSKTVFEWVTDKLGAQGTVCAGGRYDALVEQIGGKATPAIGFALGLERLITMLQEAELVTDTGKPHAYLVMVGDLAQQDGLVIAEQLRNKMPGLRLQMNSNGGSFKSQFKRANSSGARFALVLGDDEIAGDKITVKDLRRGLEQQVLTMDETINFIIDNR